MITPTKHVNFSESFLGFGGYVLENIQSYRTVDELWKKYLKDFENGLYFARHSFDNLVSTIVFLYSIGAIIEKDGEIVKCN